MITIKDVAAAAGVSATTVSNVIHGYSSRVSQATSNKIQSVIEELGYIPNLSARSLVSRSSHVIALINHLPPTDETDLVIDPFHMRAIAMFESSLRECGYYLMVRSCSDKRDLITFLQNWNADGLFVSEMVDNELAEALIQSGKPVVTIDTRFQKNNLSYILQDDYQGGCLAASYLLEHGHTDIGYAASYSIENTGTGDRLKGFRDTLKKAGHPLKDSRLFVSRGNSLASNVALTEPVREAVGDGMTAMASSSDQVAIYLLSTLKKKGIRFPEDLSLIGFGNLPQDILCDPELTTIHYPIGQKAALAVSCMLRMLKGEQTEPTQILLPVGITERASVRTLNR